MNLPINTLLQGGKYKIVRFIASGGFGCTYEARHVLLQNRVAIKEFFVKDYCNRDEYTAHVTVGTISKKGLVEKLRNKFVDEARALFNLHHDSIVRVTDVFEENGTAYFVMDYIEGKSLGDIIKSQGALPEHKALKYIRQVAEALRYVHDNKRLHLDVKPGNIMIDNSGKAVLIDFGASKQYEEENGENTSTLMGKTPGYAPLEQMGNDVVKFMPATDIYALGATLYKAVTGKTPPSSNKLASGEEDLAPIPTKISQATRNAVTESMRIRKTERPQSVEEFLAILDDGGSCDDGELTDVTVVEEKADSSYHTDESHGNEAASPVKKYSIVAVCAFCVVALVYFLMPGSGNSSEPQYVRNMDYTNSHGVKFVYSGMTTDGIPNDTLATGEYKDGNFKGIYKNGERSKGTYKTADGTNTFVGSFENDKYSEGRLTFDDGSYYIGTFRNDDFYTGKFYEKSGKVYSEIKQGMYVE